MLCSNKVLIKETFVLESFIITNDFIRHFHPNVTLFKWRDIIINLHSMITFPIIFERFFHGSPEFSSLRAGRSNIIIEGLPGILGNKGTLAKYRRKQGNMSVFLGNRGTKLYKLEDENIASKFIKRGTNKENVWEHGNIGQFWKGTRTHPGRPSSLAILPQLSL